MTPADLDALIERMTLIDKVKRALGDTWTADDCRQAAAALVQLRDSEALARGKIAEQMIEIARLHDWYNVAIVEMRQRAERAEAEVVRLTQENGNLAQQYAKLKAENALLKDDLRQANGVRDVFAEAVVLQAMKEQKL
jgi:hypothetical protein